MKRLLTSYKFWLIISVLLFASTGYMLFDSLFGDLLSSSGYEFEARESELREQLYEREDDFRVLDRNQDQFLTVDEYYGLEKLFVDLDTNGDGRLSMLEAKYMIAFSEIPEGSFIMGMDEEYTAFFEPEKDMAPAHEVYVDTFLMAKTELTNAQYVLYLNSAINAGEVQVTLGSSSAPYSRIFREFPTYIVEGQQGSNYEDLPFIFLTQAPTLSHETNEKNGTLISEHPFNQSFIGFHEPTNSFFVDPGFEDLPVVNLRWWGAMAFAEYYGISLPTEAEWEKAAAGGQQMSFPTSTGSNDGKLSNHASYNAKGVPFYKGNDSPEDYVGFRLPVGSYEPNPYRLYDLAGNVWEWTLDWYDPEFYGYTVENGITRNPLNTRGEIPPELFVGKVVQGGPAIPLTHDAKVSRGGSYNYSEAVTRTEFRLSVYQFLANDHFGCRVVVRPETTEFNLKE